MLYKHDIESCFTKAIGPRGISEENFHALLAKIKPVLESLKEEKSQGKLPLLSSPAETEDIEETLNYAKIIKNKFSNLVILGTGGSTLSGQALANLAGKFKVTDTALYFLDNIDPDSFDNLFAALDFSETGFLVISKSGSTLETVSQFLLCVDVFAKAAGRDKISEHFFLITDPKASPLRNMAQEAGITIIDHNPGIGGRFSILTNVGLLPAAIAGLDIKKIREGAAEAIDENLDIDSSEAAKGAAINIALAENGINATIFMPYIDRLNNFTSWLRQIWAESLGKNGNCTTPIKAMGTLDQHSQLQLYLDGPKDKMFTLITLKKNAGKPIDYPLDNLHGAEYMRGKSMGEIMDAEQQATIETLKENSCPVRCFELESLDEKLIGALSVHFMIETIITAKILNINAFDQPAVEHGKALARKLLGEAA